MGSDRTSFYSCLSCGGLQVTCLASTGVAFHTFSAAGRREMFTSKHCQEQCFTTSSRIAPLWTATRCRKLLFLSREFGLRVSGLGRIIPLRVTPKFPTENQTV